MPLNDRYDFERDAPPEHRAAFTRSFGVNRVLLNAGTELIKLTEYGLDYRGAITPWWNFYRATTLQLGQGRSLPVPGWEATQARAHSLGASDVEFGRARSAVPRAWNQMSSVLKARLMEPAYGWFGRNSGMHLERPRDPSQSYDRTVVLIGGAYQVYIPNLRPGKVIQL